jgi:hypothetical protein
MRKLFTVLQGVESTPLPAKTPDITKAQVGGWLQFAVSTAVALTLVSPAEAEVLIGASGIIAFGIHISDAIIRKGRAGAIAALTIAQADQGSTMGSTAPGEGEELPPVPHARRRARGGRVARRDGHHAAAGRRGGRGGA